MQVRSRSSIVSVSSCALRNEHEMHSAGTWLMYRDNSSTNFSAESVQRGNSTVNNPNIESSGLTSVSFLPAYCPVRNASSTCDLWNHRHWYVKRSESVWCPAASMAVASRPGRACFAALLCMCSSSLGRPRQASSSHPRSRTRRSAGCDTQIDNLSICDPRTTALLFFLTLSSRSWYWQSLPLKTDIYGRN